MRNVRMFYEKLGRMRFVSHLDMNRFMSRIIHKMRLPIWYTEGYNCHPYITFALPLSLGFESRYEIMDFRIVDDTITNEQIAVAFSNSVPEYIKIISVAEPVMKPGSIAFAAFEITINSSENALYEKITAFLDQPEILIQKKSKKGAISIIDIAPKIKNCTISTDENIIINIVLPAGGKDNVNPSVILSAMSAEFEIPSYKICRIAVYNSEMELFI